MIAGISGFVFFFSKSGRFVTQICFSRIGLPKPQIYIVLGVRVFGPRCQKKEILDPPQMKEKNWFITEKLILEN